MLERVVMNTGPLVALARIDALEIIGLLPVEFICPEEVYAELREGERQGHIPATPGYLHIRPLAAPLSPLAVSSLDTGEAAVIQLALESRISHVCIDESKGRRAALSVGLKVMGTLGILGLAKTQGLIPAMRPYLEKALAAGIYYDTGLVNTVLKAFGE
mgnify:FL=1